MSKTTKTLSKQEFQNKKVGFYPCVVIGKRLLNRYNLVNRQAVLNKHR